MQRCQKSKWQKRIASISYWTTQRRGLPHEFRQKNGRPDDERPALDIAVVASGLTY
jgi:hypothetical protein